MRRSACCTFAIALAISIVWTPGRGYGQDAKDEIQKRLDNQLVLTTANAARTEILKAGSIIELEKDNLVMWSVDTAFPPINMYQAGKISIPPALAANVAGQLRKKQPNIDISAISTRIFGAGEKFWVVRYWITDKAAFFLFGSDAYNGTRYYGELALPFFNAGVPPADQFMKTLAEVITVLPPPGEEAAAPKPPAQPAMAPIPAPAPPPKVVTLGQTQSEVIAILGTPQKVAIVGAKEIDYYSDMKITYLNGKVTDIQ